MRAKNMSKPKKPRKPHLIIHSILLVLAVSICVAAFLTAQWVTSSRISSYFTRVMGQSSVAVSDTAKEEADNKGREIAAEIESEGAVLLSNNGTLPFESNITKVNVFGWASIDWQGGGSGSGGVSSVEVDFLEALENYGIETNTELSNMYRSFQNKRETTWTLGSKPEESSVLYEPSISDDTYYSDELLTNAKKFSDTAIVVLGRLGGESNDFPLTQYKVTKSGGNVRYDKTRTSLDLSSEEEALLAYVGANYERVCVVINSANTLNLAPLKTTVGIDAALLVGYTGQYSAEAIPAILWGETNPSGRTVDTYAYDFETNPSYASASENIGVYTDAEGLYPADGTQIVNFASEEPYEQVSYIDYSEGIYVGYRWYETADAEGYWSNVSNKYGDGYDGVVQYAFGYGLSYTTFDWEVLSAPAQGSRLGDSTEITVRVANTGDVAGKDVVELYYTAPYIQGGIEKSSVVLGAFAKTDLLAPGESQDVVLTLSTRDMASYDYSDANKNGFKGYELDAGTYILSLRHNAHEIDDAENAQVSLRLYRNLRYSTDETTGAEVSNKFTGEDAVDGVGIDGTDTGQNITYLSRADFAGTFPEVASSRAMPEEVTELNLYTAEDAAAYWQEADASATMPLTRVRTSLRIERNGVITSLGLTLGSDYNASEWDSLLNQLNITEMEDLVNIAYSGTSAVASVGKEYDTKEADGPSQIDGFFKLHTGTGFPCSVVVAQTWNTELANKEGLIAGVQASQRGYSGWYAPGTNLHRTAFGGRNYEYYSEDVLLSGTMCGNVVSGARDAGVYCYVKHFVANDSEAYTFRDSVYEWMTEQALREMYLEPFRIIIEDYHATALMSSYNRLGAVWAGGSKGLLTSVLRGEWGFGGTVITDYSDHIAYMSGDQMLAAGGDLWMQMSNGKIASYPNSASYVSALRNATKHVLYTYLNARVANETYVENTGNEWAKRPESSALYTRIPKIVGGALYAIGALLVILAIRGLIKDIKLKKALAAEGGA